jgi:hypothetical protein
MRGDVVAECRSSPPIPRHSHASSLLPRWAQGLGRHSMWNDSDVTFCHHCSMFGAPFSGGYTPDPQTPPLIAVASLCAPAEERPQIHVWTHNRLPDRGPQGQWTHGIASHRIAHASAMGGGSPGRARAQGAAVRLHLRLAVDSSPPAHGMWSWASETGGRSWRGR